MFTTKTNHVCSVRIMSKSYLPKLSENASCFSRFLHKFKKSILISENVPRSAEFYRSTLEILHARREQVRLYPWIIHPFSKFRAYYEMWMALLYFVSLIYTPLEASFNDNRRYGDQQDLKYVTITMAILCYIDVIMTFFSGYSIEGTKKVVMKPKKICISYVLSIYFYSDILSVMPVERSDNKYWHVFFEIVGMIRIVRLSTFYSYMKRSVQILGINPIVFRYIQFFLVCIIVFHWFTCLHYIVPHLHETLTDSFHYDTWLIRHKLLDENILTKYVASAHRAVGYLLCVGWLRKRDTIVWEEILVEIVTLIFGKIFFLFLTVIILQTMLSLHSLETKYFATISQVNEYMRQKKLPVPMQNRMLQYYNYKYNRRFYKENVIAGLLSEKLRREINMQVCKKLVHNVTLFANLPSEILENILIQLKPEIFLPNDIIIKAGATGDCMYFLSNGTVSVTTLSGKEICHLQDGAYFGEICLLFKTKKRTANIVAIEICEVYKLDRRIFKNCFVEQPELLKTLEDHANERIKATNFIEDIYKQSFL